jgi:hypothetical protein
MKRHAKTAFDALKKMGAPVIYPDMGWGEHFAISGESNHPEIWADYWKEFGGPGLDGFGVSLKINAVLEKNGLFAEWINAGVLGVYDA